MRIMSVSEMADVGLASGALRIMARGGVVTGERYPLVGEQNEARGGRVIYVPAGHSFYTFPVEAPEDEDA